MSYRVRPYRAGDREPYSRHAARSHGESGRGEPPFNPYEPGTVDLPTEPRLEDLEHPLAEPGWRRLWLAVDDRDGIVGHMDLKGSKLDVGMHRCLLGIAIERDHRGRGVGRLLMQAAIDFARGEPGLDWIDLSVFSHNTPALKLYRDLGFVEQGRIEDKFRISGESITDILMTLKID